MELFFIKPNYYELIGAIAGLIGVWLTAKQIIWCWPVALINVVLSMYVFYDVKLYQDFLLQILYFILTLYGWHNWIYGGRNKTKLNITKINKKTLLIYLVIGIAGACISGYLFKQFTDASLPYGDATLTVSSIIATIWMARKHIENWTFWIIIDAFYVAMCLYKGLPFFAIQYFIFIILAFYGLVEWNKTYKLQTHKP